MYRCPWSGIDNLMQEYHDTEWGVPAHDEHKLFEFLILEGAQAGLSWQTILNRRQAYYEAFDNFDPEKVALFDEHKAQELITNSAIIRNKLKLKSAINNAQKFLRIQKEFGSFDKFIWEYVEFKAMNNSLSKQSEIPAQTDLSTRISKDLKKKGFSFVGPTIIYAFMQATGMVNDHLLKCFRYKEVQKL